MSNSMKGKYPGYPNIYNWYHPYLQGLYRERLAKIMFADESESETINPHIRYVCVYNPANPYLLFLVFILLIMSFNPPYQMIAYAVTDEAD